MAQIPYLLVLNATLAGNAAGTVYYPVPQNEKLVVRDIRVKSTGDFTISDIRDSGGNHFTNASPSVPIPADTFQNIDSPNLAYSELLQDLEIAGGNILYIDIKDTTGSSNTVNLLLNCIRTTAG